jgi:hypothetical protein
MWQFTLRTCVVFWVFTKICPSFSQSHYFYVYYITFVMKCTWLLPYWMENWRIKIQKNVLRNPTALTCRHLPGHFIQCNERLQARPLGALISGKYGESLSSLPHPRRLYWQPSQPLIHSMNTRELSSSYNTKCLVLAANCHTMPTVYMHRFKCVILTFPYVFMACCLTAAQLQIYLNDCCLTAAQLQIYLNDYCWRKAITYIIPTTHILYVTSTE